jgi:hypothetical protein
MVTTMLDTKELFHLFHRLHQLVLSNGDMNIIHMTDSNRLHQKTSFPEPTYYRCVTDRTMHIYVCGIIFVNINQY